MKTIQINLHSFEELDEKAKRKALQDYHISAVYPLEGINMGIPLKLIRRSAATWKCVPPVFDHGVPGGLTRYSGAN